MRKKLFWISLLYFSEGLPLGIVYDVFPVYFRQHGVGLKEIGFLFFLTLPWAIKVFWAPLVDRFGDKKNWIAASCVTLASVMVLLTRLDPARPSLLLWAMLLLFSFAAATQDIAIDAYSIGLLDKGEEGIANGFRVSLYRIALLIGGGGTMLLVQPLGWNWIFYLLGGLFLLLSLIVRWIPPVTVVHQPRHEWIQKFWLFLSRRGSIAIFLFILTYKMGDLLMGSMVKPFWVDQGMTPQQIGTISTMAGVVMSILGALLGGLFTSRYGIFRGLWVLGLGQALSNLGYAAVAGFHLGPPFLYTASVFESFTAGLGSAAFMAFLMRICDKNQAATQYALLTALFGLTRFFGGWSGLGVEWLGYARFFLLTFGLALPAYLLLPWVRGWVGETATSPGPSASSGPPSP